MKTLYESLLSDFDTLSKETDTIMDKCGTTKNIFTSKHKSLNPMDFNEMRWEILDHHKIINPKIYDLTKEEAIAFADFIMHMHAKYGQQDMYNVVWCVADGRDDYMLYELHKKLSSEDKELLNDRLNLNININARKVDQWIAGLHDYSETAWFFCTLKNMEKDEKEAWEAIMKSVERYFN